MDLSELKTERIQGAQRDEEATPRDKRLKDPLEKLVNLGAEALAVDVYFSPKETYRHVVLVGDVQSPEPSDEFRVPGRLGQVPGVYVHACAMYTPSQTPSTSSRARLGGAWI